MKIKKVEWYGLNHAAVKERFEGDLTFVNEFSVTLMSEHGEVYVPCAVYKAKTPNKKKGHKKYMLLFSQFDPFTEERKWKVTGKTQAEMNKDRYQDAIHCLDCDTVLYSIDRHHFHRCGCSNDTFIDGGRDYNRCGAMSLKRTKMVKLDLLTDKIVD